MAGVLPYLIGAALAAVLGVLAVGVFAMLRGGEFNRKYAQYTQEVPDVLVAHGAVLRALPLPTPAAAGATGRSA